MYFQVMKSITVECPERIHEQLEQMVQAGWIKTTEEVVIEALRRYVESHGSDLKEAQILKDVEWGLHGDD